MPGYQVESTALGNVIDTMDNSTLSSEAIKAMNLKDGVPTEEYITKFNKADLARNKE